MVNPVTVFVGGTGASNATDARENLGLGVNVSVQFASSNVHTLSSNTITSNAIFVGSSAVATIDDVLALSIVLGS